MSAPQPLDVAAISDSAGAPPANAVAAKSGSAAVSKPSTDAVPRGPRPKASLWPDAWLRLRNGVYSNPGFQRWAARFPLTVHERDGRGVAAAP